MVILFRYRYILEMKRTLAPLALIAVTPARAEVLSPYFCRDAVTNQRKF